MRKDHRPFWLRRLMDSCNQLYVDHFIRPQLDSSGVDFRVMNPRSLQISGPRIHLGDHVHITALSDSPVRLAVFDGLGRIEIGSYSIVNPGVRVTSAASITVGKSCMLAMNCYLADADWHGLQHRIFAPGNSAPIVLGDNVWIGDGAYIGKGVTIGDNSIIGAYSVVTKDVPANVIAVGSPARVIRELDPDDMIAREAAFTGDMSYEEFELQYQRNQLAGNTLVNWMRSIVKPGPND